MCGLIGVIGRRDIASVLIDGLGRLEFQPYQSYGLATADDSGITVRKGAGSLADVAVQCDFANAQGRVGIAHVQWTTKCAPSQVNAQPHLSCDREFAVVYNGAISNLEELKEKIRNTGRHFFFSDAEAEIIAHLMEEAHGSAASLEDAFVSVLRRLKGVFALAMISRHEPERLLCAKQKSPLVLGIDSEIAYAGSHVEAFSRLPSRLLALTNAEYAVVTPHGYSIKAIPTGEDRHGAALGRA